jgi:hypothetical protein
VTVPEIRKAPGDTKKPCSVHCTLGSFGHTDAAKRISDAVSLHFWGLGFDCKRKWIAVRLEDGKGGEILYDSKADAVRHQLDEFLCAYICLTGTPMSVCEAELILTVHRKAYDAGFRLVDPDHQFGGRTLISPTALEDSMKQLRAFGQRR